MAKKTKKSKITKKGAKEVKMPNAQVGNSKLYSEPRPNFLNELLPRPSRW